MTDNGQAARRRMISPERLTPRDHLRAKKALAAVLEEYGLESTYHAIEDQDIAVPFTIWCLKSRANPDFTWDEALDTEYLVETEIAESAPPQMLAPPVGSASGAASPSRRKQTDSEPEPSAAPSSA